MAGKHRLTDQQAENVKILEAGEKAMKILAKRAGNSDAQIERALREAKAKVK